MSIRIEILDGITPMLEQIAYISKGAALECLSVAGAHLQRQARVAMRRKHHNWVSFTRDGKRVILKANASTRQLGLRMSAAGGLDNPDSMSAFITSYLDEKNDLVVVGGRHPRFTPNKRRDGKIVGTMGSVPGVSKASHAILHKLNFGELNDEYKRVSMRRFAHARYVGYHFMEAGYNAARSSIEESMTKRYEKIVHKAVLQADVKIRRTTA